LDRPTKGVAGSNFKEGHLFLILFFDLFAADGSLVVDFSLADLGVSDLGGFALVVHEQGFAAPFSA
jgi:hypothetical protein